jgi:hypothetical protein
MREDQVQNAISFLSHPKVGEGGMGGLAGLAWGERPSSMALMSCAVCHLSWVSSSP